VEKKWWTLVAVCVGTFMLLLDVTIVNVALPAIQQSLGASFSDLQWVVDAYALSLAALLLTTGSLADLYGRRLLFTVGLFVFTAGSLLCGLAQSPEMLIVSRGGQGVGGAIMFATSLALLAQAFQGRERGTAFGVWGAITGIAVAIGPVLGGVLTTEFSWRWIFLVNVPVGVGAVVVTRTQVAESRQPGAARPDWAGFLLFSTGLAALIYGLIRTNAHGWTDPGVLTCFVLAAALLTAFLIAERVGSHPMLDLALFKKPTFAGGSIAAFGLSASIFAMLLYIVLYLQDARGYSALGTGLRLLLISGGVLVAATISGRLTNVVPIRFLVGPGLLLVSGGLALMTLLGPNSSWTVLIPGFVVAGIGVGFVNPPLASTAVGVVEPRRAGMASGINSTFRQIGIATGVAVLGSIFGAQVRSQLRASLAHIPALQHSSAQLGTAITSGGAHHAIASSPPALRPELASATLAAFVHGLDVILVVGAVVALGAGVASLLLIRAKDFAEGSQASAHRSEAPAPAPA
jgi:EmrB/QacA subfamily drug resistance transporter